MLVSCGVRRLLSSALPVRSVVIQEGFRDSTRWDLLEARKGDIIVATPYKTGTTWMQQITNQLLCDGDSTVWPIDPELGPHGTGRWVEFPVGPPNKTELLNNLKGRRVLKTHLALKSLPYNADWYYLFVLRDPRDVCASMFNHATALQEGFMEKLGQKLYKEDEFDLWFEKFMKPDHKRNDWCYFQWVADVWPWRHLPNFKFINYNTLLKNSHEEIQAVADFCNIPVNNLDAVVHNSSFAFMKEHQSKFELPHEMMKGGRFINKGKIGGHKALLTDQHRQAILDRSLEVCGEEATKWLINA
eukprot:TRINITY_DN87275_c0_g1_i1.p1 TRINITY_DN87275_c0_g1~~TRINITY_DN87275_c0_g1_i1.p1  ORF type:complete len:301 (+),score=28.63 TRINITY_DN87275_c0_g1_i1:34-936(+)